MLRARDVSCSGTEILKCNSNGSWARMSSGPSETKCGKIGGYFWRLDPEIMRALVGKAGGHRLKINSARSIDRS